MGNVKTRTSLLQDFALLSFVTVVLFLLASTWVIYQSLEDYSQNLLQSMETEATRSDRALIIELEHSSYLLESLGRQIVHVGPQNKEEIARLLKAFESNQSINAVLSWIDADQKLAVSSNRGVVAKPVDVSDRDYMKKSLTSPWKVQIGRPIDNARISRKRVLPVALGINDYTGKYLGTLLVAIDLQNLEDKLKTVIQRKDVDFAVVSNTFLPIIQSNKDEDFMSRFFPSTLLQTLKLEAHTTGNISTGEWFSEDKPKIFSIYQVSAGYPFVQLLVLNRPISFSDVQEYILPKLVQAALVGIFLILSLWMIRTRVIDPVLQLSEMVDHITRGELNIEPVQQGPREVVQLSQRLHKVAQYIGERLRAEQEQRNKLSVFRKAKDSAELSNRIKIEFLSAMSSEIRTPLNTIVGFSEVMKNQLYGPLENSRYWQYAVDIHRAGYALKVLIEDVLSLSKAEATLSELHEKPIDVPTLLSKTIRHAADDLKQRGVNVELRVEENLPRLIMDENRMKQIAMNLLSNAVRHTPSGGTILIESSLDSSSKSGAEFVISFTDYGNKNAVKKSDPQDIDASTDLLAGLSSLGIPLTKALLAMHQATMDIENIPGKPKRVTIRFPKERLIS